MKKQTSLAAASVVAMVSLGTVYADTLWVDDDNYG